MYFGPADPNPVVPCVRHLIAHGVGEVVAQRAPFVDVHEEDVGRYVVDYRGEGWHHRVRPGSPMCALRGIVGPGELAPDDEATFPVRADYLRYRNVRLWEALTMCRSVHVSTVREGVRRTESLVDGVYEMAHQRPPGRVADAVRVEVCFDVTIPWLGAARALSPPDWARVLDAALPFVEVDALRLRRADP